MANETNMSTDVLKPGWGLAPPAGAIAAWGARALYTEIRVPHFERFTARGALRKNPTPRFTIELLWDRKGQAGDASICVELCAWVDKIGIPRLTKACDLLGVGTGDNQLVTITDGRFTIAANPRASHGYLYIGAWVIPDQGKE